MAKVNISKLLQRAKEAVDRHNYDLAIFNYIQAVSLQPENIEARIQLRAAQVRAAAKTGGGSAVSAWINFVKSVILMTIKKHEQAVIACEHAITAKPTNVTFLKQLAKSTTEAELIEAAAWQRQEIADRFDPEDIDNLFELAELYIELDRSQEAINCYEKIKEIDPDADVDGELRNVSAMGISEAFKAGVKGGARSIQKDAEEAEQQELESGKLRDDEQRMKAINYILSHDAEERPDDHKVFARLGDIYFDLEDWDTGYKEAKKYYQKALEINGTDSTTRMRLGDLEIKEMRIKLQALKAEFQAGSDPAVKKQFLELNKKNIEFQIGEYERRVKEQPLKADFHHKLGELYFTTKRFDEAISELQEASKDPKFKILALTSLGRCFLSNEQYDMAITQFDRAMAGQEIFDKIKDPTYYKATAFEAKGDPESLKQALDLYTGIYQVQINYKDVKNKVPELQKKLKG